MKRLFLLLLALVGSGVISGLIYGWFGVAIGAIPGVGDLPAVIFGLCTMWYFKSTKGLKSGIVWAGVSVLAFMAANYSFSLFPSIAPFAPYRYAIAGFVGSLILALAVRFSVTRITWWQVSFIALVGCVFGFIFGIIAPFENFLGNFLGSSEGFDDVVKRSIMMIRAFTLWQVAVGLCLGAVVKTKQIKNSN
jgi:hypothetical protein